MKGMHIKRGRLDRNAPLLARVAVGQNGKDAHNTPEVESTGYRLVNANVCGRRNHAPDENWSPLDAISTEGVNYLSKRPSRRGR
eukprot:9367074-Pyramimonas_sp.AAC.1